MMLTRFPLWQKIYTNLSLSFLDISPPRLSLDGENSVTLSHVSVKIFSPGINLEI